MRRAPKRYVRQMPRVYGNLQPQRKHIRINWVLIKRTFWLGVIGVAGYAVFLGSVFQIHRVEVEGVELSSKQLIEEAVPLNGNIWTLSIQGIEQQILKDPPIDAVRVYRGIPDSVRVVVQERQPVIIWQVGEEINLVDEDGIPFATFMPGAIPTPDSSAGKAIAELPRVIDTKAVPVTTGDPLVGSVFLDFIAGFQREFEGLVSDVVLDHYEVSDTTYDLTYVSKDGMRVQLNTLGDAGVQARNLARLYLQKKVLVNSKVDLRIDRWAYVQ